MLLGYLQATTSAASSSKMKMVAVLMQLALIVIAQDVGAETDDILLSKFNNSLTSQELNCWPRDSCSSTDEFEVSNNNANSIDYFLFIWFRLLLPPPLRNCYEMPSIDRKRIVGLRLIDLRTIIVFVNICTSYQVVHQPVLPAVSRYLL